MEHDIEDIYRQHSKYVYNVAYRMLSNRSDAEDVCHEVFIRLNNSLASFKGEANIKTFIYRMTVNQSIDHIRKQQSQVSRAERSMDEPKPQRVDDGGMVLDDLLTLLDPESRACLLLYEVCGFPQAEVAEIMKTRTGTIKSRISRAIKKISEHLKKEDSYGTLRKGNALLLP